MKVLASCLLLVFAACQSVSPPPEPVRTDVALAPRHSGSVILLKGVYNGKNVYVQNPLDCKGRNFCVRDVSVNGSISTRIIKSSAFEIDLGNYALEKGDSVFIRIEHYDCCMPKVLNPEVLDGDWLKRDSARRR